MNTDDRALADLTRERGDAELLRLIARDCDRWPGEGGSAETLRQIADRLEAFHAKHDVGAAPDMLVEKVSKAIADPGLYCGFRGDKGMSHWQAEAAILAVMEYPAAALQSLPPVVSGEVTGETLEQYSDRIVAKTRKIMMDRLPDDVIGDIRDSHLVFGKACAQIAVTTAMDEMAGAIAAEKAATPKSVPAVEEGRREVIARIIDPMVWGEGSPDDNPILKQGRDKALSKADAILALTPVSGVGESNGFLTIGENWSTTGRLELPLAMGPRLSDAAKERLRKLEELDAVALIEACKYPMGGRFLYHDEEGEHDPAYVVIPGGEMVPINGYDDGDAPIPTDVARAAFIVTACNAALSTPVAAQGDEVREALRVTQAMIDAALDAEWPAPSKGCDWSLREILEFQSDLSTEDHENAVRTALSAALNPSAGNPWAIAYDRDGPR